MGLNYLIPQKSVYVIVTSIKTFNLMYFNNFIGYMGEDLMLVGSTLKSVLCKYNFDPHKFKSLTLL